MLPIYVVVGLNKDNVPNIITINSSPDNIKYSVSEAASKNKMLCHIYTFLLIGGDKFKNELVHESHKNDDGVWSNTTHNIELRELEVIL